MHSEQLPYNDYGATMRRRLGGRVQKLAIDAQIGCPNRDGTIARGGCTFCCNEAFSPSYCRESKSITEQIDRAIEFHTQRGRHSDAYLAYFQSGTNTHAPTERLTELYNQALLHPKISGIIVGTRPDCINSDILQLFNDIRKGHYIAVEYGIESVYDMTLNHVNRGHSFADAIDAIIQTKALGIDVGAHFIIGLPGESRKDITDGVDRINALNLDFIKFHQLQIYRNTPIAEEWINHSERFLFGTRDGGDEYIALLIDIVRRLSPSVAIERITSEAPRHLLLHSPLGGIRPDVLRNEFIRRMRENNYTQGDLYTP